jgi:hypothetical protein
VISFTRRPLQPWKTGYPARVNFEAQCVPASVYVMVKKEFSVPAGNRTTVVTPVASPTPTSLLVPLIHVKTDDADPFSGI